MRHEPQVFYRLYRADGVLLYVGLTMRPIARLQHHAGEKTWWQQVSTISLEHFPDRSDVEEAERLAIANEHPLYNVVQPRLPEAKAPLPCPGDPGLTSAERLFRARKIRGLTRIGLAARAQVKLIRLEGYERGRPIPPEHVAALSRVLGFELGEA